MKTYNVFLVIYKLNINSRTLPITRVIEVIALTSTIIYFEIDKDIEILCFSFSPNLYDFFFKDVLHHAAINRQLDVMIETSFLTYEYKDKHVRRHLNLHKKSCWSSIYSNPY